MSNANLWTNQAACYEKFFTPILTIFAQDALVLSSSIFLRDGRVLDIACGTGAMTIPLLEKHFKVTATDISKGMIDILKEKVKPNPLNLDNAFECDGNSLNGIKDSSFDIVCSSFGIALFPDRSLAWKSVIRVLTPNGVLLALSWSKDSGNFQFVEYLFNSLHLDNSKNFNKCTTEEGFKEEVTSAGFHSVVVNCIHHELVYESGLSYFNAMYANPFFPSLISKIGIDKAQELCATYFKFDTVEEFLKSPVHMLGKALVCWGIKR